MKRERRQYDYLSSKLFHLVLENIFKTIDWKEKRINIDGKLINHLKYVNEILMVITEKKTNHNRRQRRKNRPKYQLHYNYISNKERISRKKLNSMEMDNSSIEIVRSY